MDAAQQGPIKSCGVVIERWAVEHSRTYAARYIVQVKTLLSALANHAGVSSWSDLNREHVAAFIAHLAESGRVEKGKRKRPPSGQTLNNSLSSVRSFLDWGVKAELWPKNVAKGVAWSKHDAMTRRAFTARETCGMIEGALRRGSALRASLYRFLASFGVRIGTAEVIRWRHLDFARSLVVLPASIMKTRNDLTLAMSELDVSALLVLRGDAKPEPDDFVFGPRPHMSVFKRDAKAGGVALTDHLGRQIGYHCFRRYVATELARAKISPKAAQRRLGHKDIRTTLKHYTDEFSLEDSEAANLLAARVYGLECEKAQQKSEKSVDKGTDSGDTHAVTGTPMDFNHNISDRLNADPCPALGACDKNPDLGAGPRSSGLSLPPVASQHAGVSRMGATGVEPVARPGDDARASETAELIRLFQRQLDLLERARAARGS